MRDPKRIPVILEQLRQVWQAHPDLRLGQIVRIAGTKAGWGPADVFSLEDSDIQRGLKELALIDSVSSPG